MKKLLLISVLWLIACNGELSSTHEIRYSPDGADSIAYVTYREQGKDTSFPVAYELFVSLYKQGGYDAVWEYHNSMDMIQYYQKKYKTYKPKIFYKQ